MTEVARLRLSVTAVLAGVVMGLSAAPAHGASIRVVPTGQFPEDLENVQAAVDRGGRVVLGATNAAGEPTAFDFGPASTLGGGVEITADVFVTGEKSGWASTTIIGGWVPLLVRPGVDVTITRVTFQGPFDIAVRLDDVERARIVDNRIEHVVGFFVNPTLGFADGIQADSGGDIVIKGNVIDDVDAPIALGISQFGARGDVLIAENRVRGTNTIAIESSGNSSTTRIVGNTVAPGPRRYPRGGRGDGIAVNGPGSFVISDNDVTCVNLSAECIRAFGISGFFDFGPVVAPVIEGNRIALGTGTEGGIGIVLTGQVSRAKVAGNKLTGTGFHAFALFDALVGTGSDLFSNVFEKNKIGDFASTEADVFFDVSARDNTFEGQCRSVIDLGVSNNIECTQRQHLARAAGVAADRADEALTPFDRADADRWATRR